MSDPSPSSSSPPPAALKRKRPDEDDPHRLPLKQDSQEGEGVFVDIPQPSSSAMAAYNLAHLPSSQLGESQISLPTSLFDSSQPAPPTQGAVASGSEYVPSTQHDTSNSTEAANMRPLPALSTTVFEPYLDDTTGMDLEIAESRIALQQREDRRRRGGEGKEEEEAGMQSSSPVESFSPQQQQQVVRPEDVPRIGTWVLPPLTAENSNPYVGVVREEVLSQIPVGAVDHVAGQSDEDSDRGGSPRRLAGSQVQARERRRGRERTASGETAAPIQSTPAIAPAPARREEEQEPEPIPSQPELPCSTPALPPPTAPTPAAAPSASASHSTTTSSSVGWSTLPRPELISLMHASPHIPSFLKDEIERYILRSSRASHSSSQSQSQRSHRGSSRRRSHSQSQSQSQSNNDDSETQEDGFLRTKRTWVMDLLLLPTPSSTLESIGELGERVGKLTQQSQSQAAEGRGSVAVILLLDTVEMTFDVHELEESLASVLRGDRRYSVHYDCDGRRCNASSSSSSQSAASATIPTPAGGAADSESANAQITLLQSKLESAAGEIEALLSKSKTLQKEKQEAEAQHDFIRSLYDRASSSSSSTQSALAASEARVAQLEQQLASGLALHSAALAEAIARWKRRVRKLEAEREFERKQRELTDADEVRRKAAMWDQLQAQERDRERTREDRIRASDVKRRKLALELGADLDAIPTLSSEVRVGEGGMGPFAQPLGSGRIGEDSPIDELDELAALAREAAEAGDLATPSSPLAGGGSGGRSRRSRRAAPSSTNREGEGEARSLSSFSASNRPPPTAGEVAAQVEAANFSSSNALEDSRLELEDQFAIFSSAGSPHQPEAAFGIADFNAAPSAAIPEERGGVELFDSRSEREPDGGWGEGIVVESGDLPPTVGSQSLLGASAASSGGGDLTTAPSGTAEGGQESLESTFQPHTQP